MQALSHYWEGVRRAYVPFEADIRSGTSDVYNHEMPGGQYTNLREQARAMGLEHRWPEVSKAYADVNILFGDIVKVTPTSKVVGDMALFMVANDLKPEGREQPGARCDLPRVRDFAVQGRTGFSRRWLPQGSGEKGAAWRSANAGRAGDHLPRSGPGGQAQGGRKRGWPPTQRHRPGFLPDVPQGVQRLCRAPPRVQRCVLLPTSPFFYGLLDREEIAIDIDKGKTLVVRQTGRSDTVDEEGKIKVFFELNGQPRTVRVHKAGLGAVKAKPKAEEGNPKHVGAPMPGMVVTVAVKVGQKVSKGDPLLSMEAMKMETMLSAMPALSYM
jgi:pyruvate carboxylase